MLDEPIEGVNLIVSPQDDLGRPTGEISVCDSCGSTVFQVTWKHSGKVTWVCMRLTKYLGEGVYQIQMEKLCGETGPEHS